VHWGQSASSEDFQKAFAAISGGNPGAGKKGVAAGKNNAKALANLFSVWVYGVPTETAKKKK
jgi:hypothetical protein